MGEGGCDEEVASSKKKNRIEDQSAKINTIFMTKMAAKWLKLIPYLWPKRLKNHTLWGRTYLYKGVPPPGLVYFKNATWFTQKSELFLYHCWSTITVNKIEESKDVATTRNWGPENAEKESLSSVWSLRAMVYVIFCALISVSFCPVFNVLLLYNALFFIIINMEITNDIDN